jgi:ribose/xylose/arabinose/galactoside ABC-type transport system permease subunit
MASVVANARVSRSFRRSLRGKGNILLVWGILLLLVMLASLMSDRFLSPFNLERLAAQMAALALVSIGQTFVLLLAGIDLSVGSTVSFVGTVIVAIVNHASKVGLHAEVDVLLVLAVAVALIMGILLGFLNGLAVTRLRVSPFMATLASLSVVQGLALIVSVALPGTLPRGFSPPFTGDVGGVPIPLMLVLTATVIAAIVLRHTAFGRHVYAVGSNEPATRLSGMATDRIKILVYIISGFMAAFAGVYTASRTLSGDPLIGENIAFESITAVVLGGVSLFGGRGSVWGTIAGVLIIAILSNMMNLLRIPSDYQYVLRGALLVLAVMLYSRRSSTV